MNFNQPQENFNFNAPDNNLQNAQSPQPPQPKKSKTLIIILAVIFGLIILATLFVLAIQIILASFSNIADKPYAANDKTSTEALSYKYGETTTKERIFGVDVSGLRTKMGYTLDTSGATNYSSTTNSCHVGINHGFAPKEFINTGDDENSTDSLLIGYVNKPEVTKTSDKTFKYVSSDGKTGSAPVKYVSTTIDSEGTSKNVGVYARVITGGQGIIVTMLVACDTEEEFMEASSEFEKTVVFWDTEAKY